jgi:hypothetical protein
MNVVGFLVFVYVAVVMQDGNQSRTQLRCQEIDARGSEN